MRKKNLSTRILAVILTAAFLTGCGGAKTEETTADIACDTATEEYYTEVESTSEAEVWDMFDSEMYNLVPAATESMESYVDGCYEYPLADDYYIEEPNTEEYSDYEEQKFVDVMSQPLSTFGADVDTASYSNMRRMIEDGYDYDEFPENSIRIEELLNYFDYDYKEPKKNEPFSVNTEISTCPWNEDHQLLMAGFQTEEIDFSDAPPSNLVFLIDVSGSMYDEDKLPLLQEAFCMLAENLGSKDRVSIVTYASGDRVVLKGAKGNDYKKISKAIMSLEAGGGTNGSDGILTAYELAEDYFIEDGNNRVILATDGDLNIGITDEDDLEDLISEKKESGVFLSVLGFGTGNIKDNKMETLADKGNGNYSYIDSLKEARKVLVEELGSNMLTICKDVKFQVEFNPEIVEEYRLIGYDNRTMSHKDFDDDTKDGGEIGAGHSVTVLYEIVFKDSLAALNEDEIGSLKYADEFKKEQKNQGYEALDPDKEWLTISVRYKKPAGDKSNLLEYPVSAESFTYSPSDSFRFAGAVAEFGLLASDSEYKKDADIDHVIKTLKNIELDDEYKEEFYDLVREAE